MIYLARGVEKYYKIGYSKSEESLTNRVKSLQTGCPVKIEIIKTIEGSLDDEKQIHNCFNQCRKQGEWFEFNDFILDKVCNYMKKLENENNINFITIKEYDYRIKDHGKYKPNTIEYRHTENCYEIMKENAIYCPGQLGDECFEWADFDLKELSDFQIKDYQILYKWILKNHKEFFSYDNGRYMFDILECSEFDYYLDFKFKLYKIGELLKSDVFSALYKLAGDESPIWDKMIDISSSASTYVHKHQQHLEKITEPRNTLYYIDTITKQKLYDNWHNILSSIDNKANIVHSLEKIEIANIDDKQIDIIVLDINQFIYKNILKEIQLINAKVNKYFNINVELNIVFKESDKAREEKYEDKKCESEGEKSSEPGQG
jgi:hypothetical protein